MAGQGVGVQCSRDLCSMVHFAERQLHIAQGVHWCWRGRAVVEGRWGVQSNRCMGVREGLQ